LAGGVIIGACSGLFTNSGASLIVGAFGGVVSTLGYSFFQDFLKEKIGLYDTAGVNNLHGIPGVLGGLISAIAISVYTTDPLNNSTQQSYLNFYSNTFYGRSFNTQGAIQVAGTFISVGIGVGFGIIAGLIMCLVYSDYNNSKDFYNDSNNFEDM
jgi:ammonium transporter Rh